MRSRAFLAAAVLVAALPAAATAQNQSCDLVSGPATRLNQFNSNTPNEVTYIGGGVQFDCASGTHIRADSAVILQASGQRFLIGHAYYGDAEKVLTADRITFYGKEGHLNAIGGTVLTDKVNGAVIRGDNLDYFMASATRKQSQTLVYGGRPHAVLRPRPAAGQAPAQASATASTPGAARVGADTSRAGADTSRAIAAAPAAAAAPQPPADTTSTLVDADQMEIVGQNAFKATGSVVLDRGDMHGTAEEVDYAPDANHLTLVGNAHVDGGEFKLSAGTIAGTLAANTFKDVTATFQAVLEGKEITVRAPSVTLSLDSGQVNRLVALSAERAKRTQTDGKALAEAVSKEFRVVADSIDARAPAQKLDTVVAVGNAYGERLNDSIQAKLPEMVSKDWLRGDTIIATFADATPAAKPAAKSASGQKKARKAPEPVTAAATAAPGDTTQRVLKELVAIGADQMPARSAYRMVDEKHPDGMPAINYLLANRITVAFRDGEVHAVQAEGEIRGIHLEPQPPAPEKKDEKKGKPQKNVAESANPRRKS